MKTPVLAVLVQRVAGVQLIVSVLLALLSMYKLAGILLASGLWILWRTRA